MNIRFSETLKDKPVEMLAAVAMIFAGFASTLMPGAHAWQVGMGNLLAILGGILLSWSTATIRTDE